MGEEDACDTVREQFLQAFGEKMQQLPPKVHELLRLLRVLDEELLREQAAVERAAARRLLCVSNKLPVREEDERCLREAPDCLQWACLRKERLAKQMLSLVDQQVRTMDAQLAEYEHSFRQSAHTAPPPPTVSPAYQQQQQREQSTGRQEENDSRFKQSSKCKNKHQQVVGSPGTPGDATQRGTEEQTWCYCNRVGFGEMIACESEDPCPIEWFHFACVGITTNSSIPEQWFCAECRLRFRHASKAAKDMPYRQAVEQMRLEQEEKQRAAHQPSPTEHENEHDERNLRGEQQAEESAQDEKTAATAQDNSGDADHQTNVPAADDEKEEHRPKAKRGKAKRKRYEHEDRGGGEIVQESDHHGAEKAQRHKAGKKGGEGAQKEEEQAEQKQDEDEIQNKTRSASEKTRCKAQGGKGNQKANRKR